MQFLISYMQDVAIYIEQVRSFIEGMKGSIINQIIFIEDESPSFEKSALSFHFKYCNSIYIISGTKNFEILTSQSEQGLDTFWIREVRSTNEKGSRKQINQVAAITWQQKHGLPYKIEFQFPDQCVIIIVGEIYETINNEHDYKIQDEMILAFETKEEALKFELLTK